MSCILSVIVPAFNSEEYIARCIKSIQICKDIDLEILVINDGSTDNTEGVIRELSKQDSRIIYFSQSNQGVSAARNLGINNAKGKYILFCDSDDAFEGENLKKLICYAEKTNADVTAFGRVNHTLESKSVFFYHNCEVINVKKEMEYAISKTIFNQKTYGWSSCNKLFRRTIIENNNIRFVDYKSVNSEDRLFNLAVFLNSDIIAFYDECAFHNYVRDNSLSRSNKFPNVVERNIKTFEYVYDYLKDIPFEIRSQIVKYYYISYVNNVAVLDLVKNKTSYSHASINLYRVMEGMNKILNKQLIDFRQSFTLPGITFKYQLLNWLIFKHNNFFAVKILLFGYIKLFGI